MDKKIPLECSDCGAQMGSITIDTKHEPLIAQAEVFCMECPAEDEEEEEGEE